MKSIPTFLQHLVLSVAILCLATATHAQSAPDAGRLLQEVRPPTLIAPPRADAPNLPVPPDAPARALEGNATVTVKTFVLRGVTAIPESEIQEVLKPFVGRALTFTELNNAAKEVTAYYRVRGFILARAYLPAQEIRAGRVEIAVLEGRMGKAEVSGDGPRVPRVAAERILHAQITPGSTIGEAELERALLLIADLPGATSKAEISRGEKAGDSDVRVQLTSAPLLAGSVDLANSGNRYIGEWRAGGTVYMNSPMGLGDQIILNGASSGSNLNYGRIDYSLPVGGYGTRAGLTYYALDYQLCCAFSALHAKGTAQMTQGYVSHPLVRSRDLNVNLRLVLEQKRLKNESLGANLSDKRLDNVPLTLSMELFDHWGGGGKWNAELEHTEGRVDLSHNAADRAADAISARTAGSFAKTTVQVSRLQQVTPTVQVNAALFAQSASKNLDSSERMSLGGPQGVRAYPVGEAVGDEGTLINLEARWNFTGNWQAIAFFDYGDITLNKRLYAGALAPGVPNHYSLKAAGVGINYLVPRRYVVGAQFAARSGSNPGQDVNGNDADGRNDHSRLWFNAMMFF